jgi:(p)ppGpp synthase/HD superfamily hydrolase
VLARLPKTRVAIAYAECRHAGQRRGVDGAPFISHPLEVAALLDEAGAPDHVVAAGVLHDVVEKTDAAPADIRSRFGAPVARLVLAVTEDRSIAGYEARKAALRRQVANAGEEALSVFAADKISKVRELALFSGALSRSRARKLHHYQDSLKLLEERVPNAPLTSRLRDELDRLPAQAREAHSLAGAH